MINLTPGLRRVISLLGSPLNLAGLIVATLLASGVKGVVLSGREHVPVTSADDSMPRADADQDRTATPVGQASLRLSMPALVAPGRPTTDPPMPTPWPTPLAQQLTDDVITLGASGRHAYLVARSKLLVLDASDPSRPTIVGQTTWSWPEPMEPVDVAVAGDRAYVLGLNRTFTSTSPEPGSIVTAVDIADPSAPRFLDSIELHEAAFGLDAVGRWIFVPGFRTDRSCQGHDGGLIVIDTGNSKDLVIRGCAPADGFPMAVAAIPGEAILSYSLPDPAGVEEAGLMWFDTRDPAHPTVTRRASIPAWFSVPRLMARTGDRVAIAGLPGPGLVLGSASDASAPWRSFDTWDGSDCVPYGLVATGSGFALRMGSDCRRPSVRFLTGDVDEPEGLHERARPRIVGSIELQHVPPEQSVYGWNAIAGSDGLLFVADPGAGGFVTIVDIRHPEAPRVVGRLD